jgi:hypothetical protein
MRIAQGGTRMFCPHCKRLQMCKAISTTTCGKPSGQRWYREGHEDLQWFRRGRKCLLCRKTFLTAEVEEDFLDELVELRTALAQIKTNAESYVRESSAASEALGRLTKSLNVLKALKLYKDTDKSSDRTIDELGISIRTCECLAWEGIVMARDLCVRTAKELLEVRNFGETNLEEARLRRAVNGLRLPAD